jgi:hypothetical protein
MCVSAAPDATAGKGERNCNRNDSKLCEIITTIHFASSTLNRRVEISIYFNLGQSWQP